MKQGHPVYPRGDHCPVCDRFIGPADVCPYCDADSARSPVLRRLRVVALLCAFGGLALLYVAARYREPRTVAVGAIVPAMNFAEVALAGRVLRPPFIAREGGVVRYCSFLLDDGTGRVRVKLASEMAEALSAGDALPGEGDGVEVEGRLELRANREPSVQARRMRRWSAGAAGATGGPPR